MRYTKVVSAVVMETPRPNFASLVKTTILTFCLVVGSEEIELGEFQWSGEGMNDSDLPLRYESLIKNGLIQRDSQQDYVVVNVVGAYFSCILRAFNARRSVIVFEKEYEKYIINLKVDHLHMMEEYEYQPSLFGVLEAMTMQHIRSRVKEYYMILLCSTTCVRDVMRWGNGIDLTLQQNGFFTVITKWIVFTDLSRSYLTQETEMSLLEDELQNINHVILMTFNSSYEGNSTIQYYYGGWETNGRKFNILELTLNDTTKGLNQSDFLPNFKYGFNGRELRLSMLRWPRYFDVHILADGTETYSGIAMNLLEYTIQNLNYSLRVVNPIDGEWGRNNNGTWTGIVGDLVTKADLSIGLSDDFKRRVVMDFSVPYEHDSVYMFYQRDGSSVKQWLPFWLPLTHLLWLGIFSAMVVVVIAMSIPVFLYEKVNQRWNSIGGVFLAVIGALCAQAQTKQRTCDRMIYTGWFFFCVIIGAVYTGSLVANFAVDIIDVPLESLDDLYNSQFYKLGITKGTLLYSRMEASEPDSRLGKIFSHITKLHEEGYDVFNTNYSYNMERVALDPSFVLAIEWTAIESTYSKNKDKEFIMLLDKSEPLSTLLYAFSFQKNSVLTDIFSPSIAQALETGFYMKWKRDSQKMDGVKNIFYHSHKQISKDYIISLSDISVSLTFFAAMILLGVFLLLLEILMKYQNKNESDVPSQ